MTLKQQLLGAATTFSAAKGISLSALSTAVINDDKFLALLRNGNKDFRARTYEKFMAYFAANWPADVSMPAAVAAAKVAVDARAAAGDAA